MSPVRRQPEKDVDELLLNAQLRDELEPYYDDSLLVVNTQAMPTREENIYLASMLQWERAPVLPICQWFDPELAPPNPETVSDDQLPTRLWELIDRLVEKKIVLLFTEHLSDRELYRLIFRDILPSYEKMLIGRETYLYWQCLDPDDNPDTWLRFYATPEEREGWQSETGEALPPAEQPPYPRQIPRRKA
ncbi:MAG: hypothetical protein R3C28_02955 [Pirellulaceae bacterium]